MKFLVTGASGFIGSRLLRQLAEQYGKASVQGLVLPEPRHDKEKRRQEMLLSEGFDIVAVDLLNLPADFSKLIKPFSVLFHLAAFGETESNDPSINAVNDTGTQLLLGALEPLLRNTRIVFTSTLAAVDRAFPDNTPQAEDYPCHPRTAYGVSKLNAEVIIKEHAGLKGYDWAIARLPTVIGQGYRPGGLLDVIGLELQKNKLFSRLSWPGRIELVDADDVVSVLIKLGVEPIQLNRIFHVSSGIAPTLDELIDAVAKLLNIPRHRIAVPEFFWACLNLVIWLPGLAKILPFKLQVVLWWLSLIVTDGFVGNGRLLAQTISQQYRGMNEMLARAYSDHASVKGGASAAK